MRERVYHDRRPLAVALRVVAIIILAAVLFCVFAFFWFRQYIVVENGELRLDLPWEQTEEIQQGEAEGT